MFTTLQKEYALIYYIQNVLGGQTNGFLHELYTPKNIETILEALIKNKIKDQQTINVDAVIKKVMPSINAGTLTDPRKPNAKFNVLPYNPVSFMELYAGKTINRVLNDMKQRVFVDDITDAKDGLAAYFVSTFTIKGMADPAFISMVNMDKRPDAPEIANILHVRYPNSSIFENIEDMSEIEEALKPYTSEMVKHNFTHKDLIGLCKFIERYGDDLNVSSLPNGINAVIKQKEHSNPDDENAFDAQRELSEADVKGKVMSASSISNFIKLASTVRFTGTIKYTKNGTLEDSDAAEKVIQVHLYQSEQLFDSFVTLLDQLLKIESLPPVQTGVYRNDDIVILTEEQYHALFPEYFVTFGSIKESVTSESEMGGSTMKSGDEAATVIDTYTGENKHENEEDDESHDLTEFSVGKTKKLTIAKMLATINGHPDTVPDKIETADDAKSMIYTLNRILVTELFDSSYGTLEALVEFLSSGKLSANLAPYADVLNDLKDKYLASRDEERNEFAERDSHIKAFATVLSELSRLAQMDPQSLYSKKLANNRPISNSITITSGGYTYQLNNLPIIVRMMVDYAKEGMFISSISLTSNDTVTCALNFLKESGLLTENNKVYTLDPDTGHIKEIIDGLDWVELDTTTHPMMSDALRNCSYIYKFNWVPMSMEELRANKFTPIKDRTKKKDSSDDTAKLIDTIKNLQYRVRPYVLKLKYIDEIMNLIRNRYNISEFNGVEAPTLDGDTLSTENSHIQMLSQDNTASSLDKITLDYYISHVLQRYEETANAACKFIRKTLAEKHLLNEDVQKTLLGKIHHDERKKAIINEIFVGKKQSASNGNIAEDVYKIDARKIFTIAQAVIELYNKVLNDLKSEGHPIASSFQNRSYVKVEDLKIMADGNSPTGKMYTEDGNGCPNDFLLNAYLIDILFEAVYLLTVHFDLQGQNKYTVQDIKDMKDIDEMERYINENIEIDVHITYYKQLLTKIKNNLNVLYTSQMMTMVVPIITVNNNVTQLTDAAYSKINSKAKYATPQKVMQKVHETYDNEFDSDEQKIREAEERRRWGGY